MTPEEIQAKIDEATRGLKDKNSELLSKLAENKKVLDKVANLDLDKLLADSKAFSEHQKKSDEEKGEYKKLHDQAVANHAAETAKLKADLEAASSNLTTLKKTTAISSVLAKKGVDPLMIDLAVSSLLPEAVVDADKVLIGGKTPEAFADHWVGTDLGKRFIVSGNSGGGAGGGDNGGSTAYTKYFDKSSKEYNLTKQAELAKTNIAEYNRLREAYQ